MFLCDSAFKFWRGGESIVEAWRSVYQSVCVCVYTSLKSHPGERWHNQLHGVSLSWLYITNIHTHMNERMLKRTVWDMTAHDAASRFCVASSYIKTMSEWHLLITLYICYVCVKTGCRSEAIRAVPWSRRWSTRTRRPRRIHHAH